MEVGISISSTHPGPGGTGAQVMIERATAAQQAGLASLSLGDSHVTDSPYFQNTPMLGRLLGEWSGRPAGCLFLLPLWHPVLVAEQVATLASIHDDTFIVQVGVGGRADQFAAWGASLATRGPLTDEAIGVINALLAGDSVSSARFGIAEAGIGLLPPRPVQWWIGAGVDAAAGIDRAARIGNAWYVGPRPTAAELTEPIARYRDACATYDRPGRVMARKDVLVLDDGDAAEAGAARLLAEGYRGLDRSRVIVGDVESVLDQLGPYAELGVDQIVARCMPVPQFVALETIAALGEVAHRLG